MSAPVSTKPWKEAFEDHFRWTPMGPQSVGIDLEARPHAPLASHPVLWRLMVPFDNPMSNGLLDSEERHAVFEVQDALEAQLRPLGLLRVGHIAGQGAQVAFLYGPESVTLEQVKPLVQAHQGTYDVEVARDLDADWTVYLQSLSPPLLHLQSRMNRRRVALLREEGDPLDVARRVVHRAHFSWELSAKAAEPRLRELGFEGFRCQPIPVPGLPWRLEFHRVDTVDEARVQEVSEEIHDVVESNHGTYEGWDCQLMAEDF